MGNKQNNVLLESMEADSQNLNETETDTGISIASENVTISPLVVSELNEFGPANLNDVHIFQLLDYNCARANIYVF